MKKAIAVAAAAALFAVSALAFAAADQNLRPAQKLMRERVSWMGAISKNTDAKNFAAVATDAKDLAAQTQKVGDTLANPLAKELTLAISSLANDIAVAASQKDAKTINAKLGQMKGKCGECHAKIRDRK